MIRGGGGGSGGGGGGNGMEKSWKWSDEMMRTKSSCQLKTRLIGDCNPILWVFDTECFFFFFPCHRTRNTTDT